MTNKVQKIRNEVERLQNELIQEREKGYGSDVDDVCILELQNVLTYIDSLQEEPVSEDLEEVSKKYSSCIYLEEVLSDNDKEVLKERLINTFKAGVKWQKEHLALTWEDIRELYIFFAEVDTEIELCKTDIKSETIGYYQEVLNRFNKQKGE